MQDIGDNIKAIMQMGIEHLHNGKSGNKTIWR